MGRRLVDHIERGDVTAPATGSSVATVNGVELGYEVVGDGTGFFSRVYQ